MDYKIDFTGKTALVVGGSSGIGNATAQAFRACGARVHVWGTRATAAEYDRDEGSDLTGLHYAQADFSNPEIIDAITPAFDSLDVLVLSQGTTRYKREEYQVSTFRHILDVNLSSLMACASRFYPMLKATRGSIIIVSSSAAFHATTGVPAYNASKAGAVGLTRTLAQAWAPEGIRVNGIAPGYIPTKLTSAIVDHPDRRQAALDRIPLGRLGTTEEMAALVLFLASPLSSYVVGQTILADGGMLL
jgi:3-oxoacyl-[acyl-carrier protein] reductase